MNARAQKKRAQRSRRNKPHRPKHVHIPVTGLRNDFGMDLHTALNAAERGHFSKKQYDRIGQALNCIYGALVLRPPKDAAVITVIEGAIRAMNDCGRRGDASDRWELRDLEQAAVIAGIRVAEAHLPYMDVLTLHDSMQRLKAMGNEVGIEAKRVFLGIDHASGPDRSVIHHIEGATA